MRILVTGASGYVGGAIATWLVAAGHDVVGLSRRGQGPAGLAQSLTADIACPADMERVALGEPCEAVVHAAAVIDMAPNAPDVLAVNCAGTQRVIALAEGWSCVRFVFISSVTVVGSPIDLPVTEQHELRPPSAYHASKLLGERLTTLAGERGLSAASLRITSPVGPRAPRGRIFSEFVRRALTGEPLEVAGAGTRAQDYVDVRDVAEAAGLALERENRGVFNVARGEAITNADLARRCVERLGSNSEVRLSGRPDPEEGVRWEVSIARATSELGYSPSFALEDSILAAAEGVASTTRRSPRLPELRK